MFLLCSLFFSCIPNFTITDRIGNFQILLEQTQSFCIEIPEFTILMFNSEAEPFDIEAQIVGTKSVISKPSNPLGFSVTNNPVLLNITLPTNKYTGLLNFGYFKYDYADTMSLPYFLVTNTQTKINFPGLVGVPLVSGEHHFYFLYLGNIIDNITMKVSISKIIQCRFYVYNKTNSAPIYSIYELPSEPINISSTDYIYSYIDKPVIYQSDPDFSSRVELNSSYSPQQKYCGVYKASKTEFIFSLQSVDNQGGSNKTTIIVVSVCIAALVFIIVAMILVYKFCKCTTSIDQATSNDLDLLKDVPHD